VFDWLFEGRMGVYVALAAVAVVLLLIGRQTGKRSWLLAGGIAAALIGVYFLLDRLVETDREAGRKQIQERIEAMVNAVKERKPDDLVRHLSDNFKSPAGEGKAEMRAVAHRYSQQISVNKVVITDLKFVKEPLPDGGPAEVEFLCKLDDLLFRCVATWDYHPPEGWRLLSARVFGPLPGGDEQRY
jgi:hypothetical protein